MADPSPSYAPRRKSRRSKRDCRMVGKWEIGRTIGKGSSGRVKIAQHIETKQYAAIKIVSKHALLTSRMSMAQAGEQQEKIMLGIEREIVIMKLINHPNVLSLYDVYETSNDLYLIIEYVEGGELFDYLVSCGRLPVDEALHYFQQIISAMDYCHRFNIAHRDLKPENLLLDRNRNIKVADFGMAAWESGPSSMLETSCGSPHYASPEVVMGKAYRGATSDIWSCGVILYALLAGRLPFDDENIRNLLEKVKIGKFDMPQDIPETAKDLISRMLEKDVSKRIKMDEILIHPFFTSKSPKLTTEGRDVEPPGLAEVTRPVESEADIDPDIFGNLKTLWHGAPDEEIIAGLMNYEKTWEKAVYHLLLKYRARHLEDYDDEEEQPVPQQQKATIVPPITVVKTVTPPIVAPAITVLAPSVSKPTAKQANLVVATSAATQSSNNPLKPVNAQLRQVQPVGPRPPPGRPSLDTTPIIQIHAATPERPSSNPVQIPQKSLPPTPLVLNNRDDPQPAPLSQSPVLPPIEVPDLGDANMQKFFMQIVEHLNTIQPRHSITSHSDGSSPAHSAVHTRATTPASGDVVHIIDNHDASQFADAEEDYVTDFETSSNGGSVRGSSAFSSGTTGGDLAKRAVFDNHDCGLGISSYGHNPSHRYSCHPSSHIPPIKDTYKGDRRKTSTRVSGNPAPLALRGSAYGSPYHPKLQFGLSNRQSNGSYTHSLPPVPIRQSTYPLERSSTRGRSYDRSISDKENAAPSDRHRVSLPRPSLKGAVSDTGVERRKSLGTKHVQIVLPGEEYRYKDRKGPGSESSRSQDGSSLFTPLHLLDKTSWFSNLFKFRPASYSLLSVHDPMTSRDECRRLLMAIGVQVTVENTGNLRCRFEEARDPYGVMAVIKPVRFRVELHGVSHPHAIAGFSTSLAMVQEKGALSTFKLLYNRLRREWDLDAPPSILKVSSTSSTSHAYARASIASPQVYNEFY